MSLKDRVESHPVWFSFVLLATGFLAGLGTYRGVLEIGQLETISKYELAELRGRSPSVESRAPAQDPRRAASIETNTTTRSHPAARRADQPGPATGTTDSRSVIYIEAADWSSHTNLEPNERYGGLVTDFSTAGASRREAVYKFSAAPGPYRFIAEYASGQPRPLVIVLNGVEFSRAALRQQTGGFGVTHVRAIQQGKVTLLSDNVLELSANSASFPHLKRFIFIPVPQ
jgi:hypothetical protein